MWMDRLDVGRKVVETSQVLSEGYMRAFSEQFSTKEQQAANSACATAAANAGWFILEALGFSVEERRDLIAAYRRSGT
jgi:hypothetical protein